MPQDNAKSAVPFTSFGGLVSHGDKRDIGLGAALLENMTIATPGILASRKGHVRTSLENEQVSDTVAVIAMTRYESPSYAWVIYQTIDGSVRAGRSPS